MLDTICHFHLPSLTPGLTSLMYLSYLGRAVVREARLSSVNTATGSTLIFAQIDTAKKVPNSLK